MAVNEIGPLDELLEAVRDECSRDVWSKGSTLARAGAFLQPSAEADELIVKLATQGGLISPTVTLWPGEGDWSCDCAGTANVCAHIAAAVIALRQAQVEGRPLAAPRVTTAQVGYRLSRGQTGLHLQRLLVKGGAEQPLESSLGAIGSGRASGPNVAASKWDLGVEQALGTKMGGWMAPAVFARVLGQLARCIDIKLDGRPITVDSTPVVPVVRIEEKGGGYLVSIADDPALTERFPNGAALCGDVLRPVGELELTGREREELGRGRLYAANEVDLFVSQVLPSLRERKVPLDVRTDRLPELVRMPPRLVVHAERQAHMLSVLPTIVYGDPPLARVDGDRLVIVGRSGRVPIRDLTAERVIERQIQQLTGLTPGRAVVVAGEDAVAMASRLVSLGSQVEGRGLDGFRVAAPLVPRLQMDPARPEAFTLGFEALGSSGVEGRADTETVLGAWRRGESLAPLDGGGYAPIPTDWLAQFGDRVADLLAARAVTGELPRAALPDLAKLCGALDFPTPPAFDELRGLIDGFSGLQPADLPKDLRATLRHYQERGTDWLAFLRRAQLGALLADDMGLGKTLQALCAIEGRTLVVAPTSVLHNWVAEARKFRPGLRTAVYHGPGRALDATADVTITTYALLRLDAEALARVTWGTVVLDEAQTIKNPDSQVAQAAYKLRAGFRIALTGTPVENRLEELWSQLHFCNPGLLGGRADFVERYARPISEGDVGAAMRLRERTRPFVLRRLKREVAPELPPRTDLVLRCELTEDERRVYNAVRVAAKKDVMERLEKGQGVMAALEALLRLRQAACHSSLVPGQTADSSSKVSLLLENLDVAVGEGHKALVFSQWTSLLDLVEPHLQAAGISYLRLDGSTRDRQGVVEQFQSDDGPPVLLVSLRAGGTGLNLTAADNVFLLDPWWNPAVEDQAADRAHRIGQDKPVFVHRLVAEDTVEEGILALQERKRAIAEAAVGGPGRADAITKEDLLALLA